MSVIIAPSILASDFANLQSEVEMINRSVADWIHLDIMDGRFVPNISFGIPVCAAIARHAQKPLDVHLMIESPENYLQHFKQAGASNITVHYEACRHLHRVVHQIKELGCQAGVALNPHTSVALLEPVLAELDLVCLMSVNPGFGGQSFIESTYGKIAELKSMINRAGSHTLIEVDGGVNGDNASKLLESGTDVLVAGSYIFKAINPEQTISDLKQVLA